MTDAHDRDAPVWPSTSVAIRADSGLAIGTGHVMRCLALARVLRWRGTRCRFLHRRQPGALLDRIRQDGIDLAELPADDGVSDGGGAAAVQDRDAAATRTALADVQADWLVVDHYGLDARWERQAAAAAGGVLAVDDLADRAHACAVLVDPNGLAPAPERYAELVPESCRRLLGAAYALMDPAYADVRRRVRPRSGPVRRVLVFYGGTDPTDQTSRALRVLSAPRFRDLEVDVVLGSGHPNRANVQALADARPRTRLYGPQPNLAALMEPADLALGAGGVTNWERCAVGLPGVVTTIAENQVAVAREMHEAGALVWLGRSETVDDAALAHALDRVTADGGPLSAIAERAWRATDGCGVLRVAEALVPTPASALRLASAGPEHKALFFWWVNDPARRRWARRSDPVGWGDHTAWFDSKLADPDVHLSVLVTPDGLALGQVRLEPGESGVELHYGLDAQVRGRGYGRRLIALALDAAHAYAPDRPLEARVRPDNTLSRRLLAGAAFRELARDADGTLRLRREPGSATGRNAGASPFPSRDGDKA